MGPGYFIIAILGCADGGTQCTPVATAPTHYATQAQCEAAAGAALMENDGFDYPTLVARCHSAGAAIAATRPARPNRHQAMLALRD